MSDPSESDPNLLFRQAVALLQSGNLAGAAGLLRRLLRQLPGNGHVLYLLGTIELELGDVGSGASHLGQAVVVQPDRPESWANLAVAQQRLGRLQEALASCNRAIALNANCAEAYDCRGTVLRAMGRLEEALASCSRAIACKPDFAGAYNNKGGVLDDLKRTQEALAAFDRAIVLAPRDPGPHYNRANLLKDLGRFEEALAGYDRAIALAPGFGDALNNRGNVLLSLKRAQEALAAFDRVIALKPDFAEAHSNRGNALLDLKRPQEALAGFDHAIALQPDFVDAHVNRANALRELDRCGEALAGFDRALTLEPGCAEAHDGRGTILMLDMRPEEALASFDRAVALKPDYAAAHANRGSALLELLRLDEALAALDRALAAKSDLVEAHSTKAMIELLMGNFAEGWERYEWRWKDPENLAGDRKFVQPQWRGDQLLAGKTVLVHAEQGYGDAIQFCRYVPMVAALGAKVIVEARRRLLPLLSALQGVFALVETGEPLPVFDLHCPMMSLPLAFKTTLATIPAAVPYLCVATTKREEWQHRLGARARPRVGLAWAGNPDFKRNRARSLALQQLAPLLRLPFEFHSLQKDVGPADAATMAEYPDLQRHQDDQNDFADAAALVSAMDIVVTVDTAVAHLAGALGKPVWIMLQKVPDWRWLLDRDDSPWYPSARLFRQSLHGDWTGVIAALVARLEAELS